MEEEKEYKQLYLFACARGLVADVEGFLEKGVSPGVQDKEKRSGAHFAAYHGELEMLQLLHSKGVDMDSEDITGRSPLHYAALRDHESTVAFLESKGAWLDACDATDSCPLHLAARAGSPAAASRLLKLGAKSIIKNQWSLTPLGEAIVHGHVKVCSVLLSAAGAAGEGMLVQKAKGGLSLLHLAAGAGKPDTVGWLLDKKVAVNDASNDEKLTPLHCSVLGGRLCQATVDKLIRNGASCGARNAKGNTPGDILVHPAANPGLADKLAELPKGVLDSVKNRLQSKASSSTSANSSATNEISKVSATVVTSSSEKSAKEGGSTVNSAVSARAAGGLSAAAWLQAATSAQEVAEVFNSMDESDRVHRVKVWARLPADKLQDVPGLTPDIRELLKQVHEAMCAAERAHTEEMLRKDPQFQEDMATPAVRSVVDSVVADPAMGPYVTGRAQQCLTKLRQLRDVLKATGDGRIHLDRLLEPWTPAVGEHVRGLEKEADTLIRDTTRLLCNDMAQLDPMDSGGAVHTSDSPAPKGAVEGETKGQEQEQLERSSLWKSAGQRLLAQLAVAALLIALLWWRQELPYQRKAREAANLAFETDSYHSLEL